MIVCGNSAVVAQVVHNFLFQLLESIKCNIFQFCFIFSEMKTATTETFQELGEGKLVAFKIAGASPYLRILSKPHM